MAYVKTLPHPTKSAYRAILEILYNASDPNALIDPYEIEEHEWIDDVTFWPPVDFGNIQYTRRVYSRKDDGLTRVWMLLISTPGTITIENSFSNIKAYLTKFLWNYFLHSFDPDNICSYHFCCPCSSCI